MTKFNGEHNRPKIEYERRFHLVAGTVSDIVSILGTLPLSVMATETVKDTWYIPRAVASVREHAAWVSRGEARPVRIREIARGSETRVLMEVKGPAVGTDFSQCVEASIPLAGAHAAEVFLDALAYVQVACWSKQRTVLEGIGAVRVCIDDYGVEGVVVEIEVSVSDPVPGSESGIRDLEVIGRWIDASMGYRLQPLAQPIAVALIDRQLRRRASDT